MISCRHTGHFRPMVGFLLQDWQSTWPLLTYLTQYLSSWPSSPTSPSSPPPPSLPPQFSLSQFPFELERCSCLVQLNWSPRPCHWRGETAQPDSISPRCRPGLDMTDWPALPYPGGRDHLLETDWTLQLRTDQVSFPLRALPPPPQLLQTFLLQQQELLLHWNGKDKQTQTRDRDGNI